MANYSTLRKVTPSLMAHSLDSGPEPKPKANHPMKSEQNQKVFRKLQEWWLQARESQSFLRLEMDIDENFYHGDQYTQEDRLALEAVNQAALVFNKTKPVIDWIIGTERRTRVDYKVLPRRKEHVEDAQVKTDVLKYISDVSKAPFARSESFREAAISGLGWIEIGVRKDHTEDPIFYRHESWRNMWYDQLGVMKDTSDWRYLFRSKWTDLDIGIAMFPDFAVELRAAANSVNIDLTTKDDDEFYVGLRFSKRDQDGNQSGLPNYTEMINTNVNNRRERVRLVECWYRMPTSCKKVSGGKHHGRVVNPANQRMMHEVNRDIECGAASVYQATVMQVYCAVFCEGTLLQNMMSPYNHNRFPFVPIFAYRKGKFHEPYGVVRNCRDPQEDLNKRYSKALYLLSTNRLVAEKGAVKDIETTREEMSRPDGIVLLEKAGAEFQLQQHVELAEEHVKLMEHDGLFIQEVSGVTSENLGRDTNAISGRAVLAKQTQGSVVTAELFDNLRYSIQLAGEITLSLAEQFYDQQKAIRITGEKNALHWHEINAPGPDGRVMNDITATQMDFIVSEQDYRDTQRQAMFESLSDIVSKMPPEMGIQMLDVVVDLTDFPGKQMLIDRIRKLNGQTDPNAKLTPEQVQEQQQAQQAAAEKKAIEMQALQLEFDEKKARIAKTNAEAKSTLAEINGMGLEERVRAEMERKLTEVQQKAAEEAAKLQTELNKKILELANRDSEIHAKAAAEIEQARIKAEAEKASAATKAEAEKVSAATKGAADIEVARITTGTEQFKAGAEQQMSALEDNLKSITTERDALRKASQDTEKKHRDEVGKHQEALHQERLAHEETARKATEETRKSAEKAKADKEKAAQDAKAQDKEAKDGKAEQQAPVSVHIHNGGEEHEVQIEKTPTGYVARKKTTASKEKK